MINSTLKTFIGLIFCICIHFACSTIHKNSNTYNEITLEEARHNGIHIVIPDTGFQKIVALRNRAVKSGFLGEKIYSEALLISGIDTIRARLRLKGDHTDHLKGSRWSYRIKTKGPVLNETKFSIQGMHTRAYFSEWLFHELLGYEGLVRLQYEYIPITVNGIDSFSGVYAFESHFRSEILKNQNKKVGPILKFNEDKFWDYKNKAGKGQDRDSLIRTISKIQLTNKKGFNKKDGAKAKEMLRAYIHQKVKAEEVFDMKKWAKFMTVNAFMSGKHALRWHNLRFYLNPETHLLEPVGFDLSSWFLKKGTWHLHKDSVESFYQSFYESNEFKQELIHSTQRMSEKSYLDQFFNERENKIDECVDAIREERPHYKFKSSGLYSIQNIFKKGLESLD